jgi:hypothetical protein
LNFNYLSMIFYIIKVTNSNIASCNALSQLHLPGAMRTVLL